MMRYMHEKRPDMLISWYDSMLPGGTVWYQNAVNDSNKDFMMDSEDGTRAVDEFFMNYNWYSTEVEETIDTMNPSAEASLMRLPDWTCSKTA